ncbi:MAG: isochorismatase family protein [Candidatus Korarchaeota archaeon]|nr:isochorismatase family protein [Candidatus Korarchaeota archaeon]
MDAFYHRYKVYVVRDAVAAFSEEDHEYALRYMEQVYGASVVGLEEAEGLLQKARGSRQA